jgi:2-polyprenyl-6-hydroxyphenyl methylase/3-demethylubiquinone-9 3-methyltransferase
MKCKICDIDNPSVHYALSNSKVYKCKNCNFHYSNFLDTEYSQNEDKIDVVLDDKLREYLKHQLQNNKQRFSNQVEISLEYLKNTESPKILDVGIGGGLYLSMMLKNKDPDCYGIELDCKRLQFAREEYGLKNIFPIPIQNDYWINNHKNTFDLITLWDVIEHVNSPKDIFKCAHHLLNEGGILIMDTPCRDTFYHKVGEFTHRLTNGKYPTFLNIMYSNHPFGHKQILSKRDVKSLCDMSNHELIYMKIFHELSFPTRFYMKKIFKNKILVTLLNPVVEIALKLLRIRNKIIFVARKKTTPNIKG